MERKGFTLIELLVVVGVIAIIAIVIVLVLNPAQILNKSRDSNRLSDFSTMTAALGTYYADVGGSMGSSSVTYISIPDPKATTTAGTDCAGLGGYFVGGGFFHCAASSTYRRVDGTGWVPVNLNKASFRAPLSTWPVDSINTTSSGFYYSYQTDGSGFKFVSVPQSQDAVNQAGANPSLFVGGSNLNIDGGSSWVLVPGNSTFGTNSFWVMQYDAVCSNGEGKFLNDATGIFNEYNNSSINCSAVNGRQVASIAGGSPIGDITHTTAVAYCQAIGAHLLTNDEYMTIVTNAANQAANWSGGSVGSGFLSQGNIFTISQAATPGGGNPYASSSFNYLRTVTLSNGAVIWDMSGNMFEHVERSAMNQGDNTNTINLPSCSNGSASWEACQFGASLSPYVVAYNDSSLSASNVAPPNSAWNTNQNAGEVYTYGAGGTQSTNVVVRGGSAQVANLSQIGLFTFNAFHDTTFASDDLGFRCAR